MFFDFHPYFPFFGIFPILLLRFFFFHQNSACRSSSFNSRSSSSCAILLYLLFGDFLLDRFFIPHLNFFTAFITTSFPFSSTVFTVVSRPRSVFSNHFSHHFSHHRHQRASGPRSSSLSMSFSASRFRLMLLFRAFGLGFFFGLSASSSLF